MYLDKLMAIISTSKIKPFVCIQDLVKNGLSLDRFTDANHPPSRHEITLFLSSWCMMSGISADDYRDWLTTYCIDILSAISSSSASQIRHSTKSTIKYVHRSDVQFSCNCQKNIFKAVCSPDCSVYNEMHATYLKGLEAEKKRQEEYIRENADQTPPDPETLPCKKRYKNQFDEAVELIKEHLIKGAQKKQIAGMLNDKGYKTSTGCKWTPTTVSNIASEKGWSPTRKKKAEETKTPLSQLPLF